MFNTQKNVDDSRTHNGNYKMMAAANNEHTRIDEDEQQFDEDQSRIEEMKMREFERRNELSVNE
ncbi:hypothetical protein JHK87_040707 [Glycine soja]|nr:hypothetical protein JHK87_040707 [Glycine soja]